MCTTIGVFLQINGFQKAPLAVVGFIFMLEPVSTIITAYFVQARSLQLLQIAGFALILASATAAVAIQNKYWSSQIQTRKPLTKAMT
jgi:drug/metabolite transporter (DMT)-like permease